MTQRTITVTSPSARLRAKGYTVRLVGGHTGCPSPTGTWATVALDGDLVDQVPLRQLARLAQGLRPVLCV